MIKLLVLSVMLSGDISPQIGDLSPYVIVEARKRNGKGQRGRRRGGSGLK